MGWPIVQSEVGQDKKIQRVLQCFTDSSVSIFVWQAIYIKGVFSGI